MTDLKKDRNIFFHHMIHNECERVIVTCENFL